MKGGFFNNPPPKKSAKKKQVEDLSHIKAKTEEQKESLKFQEVQDAMKSKLQVDSKEWLNEGLMKQMATNPKLVKAMTDPNFS